MEVLAVSRLLLILPLMLVVLLLAESGCSKSEDNKPKIGRAHV